MPGDQIYNSPKLADWQRWTLEQLRNQHAHVDLHVAGPIHLHVDGASDGGVLQRILTNIQEIKQMSTTVSAEIAELATDVAALTSAVQAAVAGFTALQEQIAVLEANGGLSASDAASLAASVAAVATETSTLAAATPPPPPPPPTP